MLLLRRIAALVLVAVWLPVTLHCRIESLVGVACCADVHDEHDHAATCQADACGVLEAGYFKTSTDPVSAPAPVVGALPVCAPPPELPALIATPPTSGIVESSAAPPELRRCHHFLVRSVLPARAPDFVS